MSPVEAPRSRPCRGRVGRVPPPPSSFLREQESKAQHDQGNRHPAPDAGSRRWQTRAAFSPRGKVKALRSHRVLPAQAGTQDETRPAAPLCPRAKEEQNGARSTYCASHCGVTVGDNTVDVTRSPLFGGDDVERRSR